MWPFLSNIELDIAENIRSRTDTVKTSKLTVWMRVFAGAGKGLILSSNNNFPLFKAAGEGASIYGSPTSVGTIGYDWEGTPVAGGSDRGLRPSPGITSFEVKEGKDQISKEATLGIKCFSLQQMEAIQKYFLEPGYTICVEWGWNTDSGGKNMMSTGGKIAGIVKQATERNLNYDEIHKIRLDSKGDYDTFFGFIVGGNVTNDGEQFNVSVKLRGAPALPTYLQAQQHIQLKNKETGIIYNSGKAKKVPPYEPELLDATAGTNDRTWNNMYNELPAHRQIQDVIDYKFKTSAYDFINMDKAVTDAMIMDANGGFWSFNRPLFGQKGTDANVEIAGQKIPKEKLWSPHKYISMDVAVEILNRNGGLNEYKFGDKKVSVHIDIKTAAIGAFRYMFSTKSSALVIPGELPDFRQYFWNRGEITQQGLGVLMVSTKDPAKPNLAVPIDNSIYKRSFVQSTALEIKTKNKIIKETPYFWGYLKNLYVNYDMFVENLNQPNKTIREVLLDILNEMSSAVNNFWHFQLVETQAVEDGNGLKKGDIIITVVDENWVGKNPNDADTQVFWHTGVLSPFLESTLDISLPSEMTNQIVSQRLSRATQPSMPYISVAKGGFFTSEKDLFSTPLKDLLNPPTAKQIEDAAAQAQLDALAAQPLSPQDEAKQRLRLARESKKNTDVYLAQINADLAALNEPFITTTIYDPQAGTLTQTSPGPLRSQLQADYKILWDASVKLDEDIAQAKIDSEKAYQAVVAAKKSQISANLAKIEILPNPELSNIPTSMTDPDGLNDETTFQERFRIYTFDDTSFLDKIKNDWFVNKGGLSHPLPIHYTFKTLGISGVRFGDTFKIRGIPAKYGDNGIFQVQQIEHTLTNMLWTTTITGGFRALQSQVKTKKKK